jgi:hypothetical protein
MSEHEDPDADLEQSSSSTAESSANSPAKTPIRQLASSFASHPYIAVFAFLLAIVGAVFTITGPIRDWNTDSTRPSSISAKSYIPEGETDFVLPFDAPLEEFPFELSTGCNGRQQSWLKEHGKVLQRAYGVEISNIAGDGAQLTVTDVRTDGQRSAAADPVILIRCPGAAEGDFTELSINSDSDHPATVFDPETGQSGKHFTFNLSPGETGTLLIRITGTENFSGKILANSTTGGKTETVVLPLSPGGEQSLVVPGIGVSANLSFTQTGRDGRFFCQSEDGSDCSIPQVRMRVAKAWHRADLAARLIMDVVRNTKCSTPAEDNLTLDVYWKEFYGLEVNSTADSYPRLVVQPLAEINKKCGAGYVSTP